MGAGGRVVVVGAGISGLTAAYELRCAGVEAVVLEGHKRLGGNIDKCRVGPLTVDSGPDGFIARDAAAADLCRRIGLGAELVEPAARGAFVWADGELRPLPQRSVLGVPWTADAIDGTGIVSAAGVEALRRGLAHDAAPLHGDATVGEVLRPRIGDEVFERLVDPLLGGINAGSADRMSIAACAPLLHQAAARGGPLGPALQEAAGVSAAASGSPVFLSVHGGVTRIVDALAALLGGAVQRGFEVLALSRAPQGAASGGWTVETTYGPLHADGVILACPAPESALLLEPLAPEAAQVLANIEYSDVALAVFAVPRHRLARPLDGSGYLVPRDQGLLTTACSWTSQKWEHYAHPDIEVLRVSAGRTDDRRWLDLSTDELVAALADELAETGLLTRDDASHLRFEAQVVPWHRSLPQYLPGHLERIAAVDAALAAETPALAVAGAALRGLGLPACIRSAAAAVERVAGVPL